MASNAIRVGILGAGYIADWHCSALRRQRGVQLVAVCDQSVERAGQLAGRYGIPATYSDLDGMLDAESVDVVHVLLPSEHHCAPAQRLLEAGVGVLLEKPMTVRESECAALLGCAEKHQRPIGISHNFLFAPIYERLKSDIEAGMLGRLEHIAITWNKELAQLRHGPFGAWVFRGPGNIMLEVGPHSVAHLLDLAGVPDRLRAEADLPVELSNGVRTYRLWLVRAFCGNLCIDLQFSFGSGFPEHTIHVRGSAGTATADFERNMYTLRRHGAWAEDFDRYRQLVREGRGLIGQARRNLTHYILSKLGLSAQGNAFGTSIARSLQSFYAGIAGAIDPRHSPAFGKQVVATCLQIAQAAGQEVAYGSGLKQLPAAPAVTPTVLVLGGTGFIGQAVVRRLADEGRSVRLLVRDPGSLPRTLQSLRLEVHAGDIGSAADMDEALDGIKDVVHLARSRAKTWAEYGRLEIAATRSVAEACLRRGVRRFVYTGTIDSYYSGDPGQVINEETPLDPRIQRRNLYARAKAEAERLLLQLHRERGLPVIIARPGVVVGNGGSPFHWGVGVWPAPSVCRLWGQGLHPLPLVLVEDVADALLRMLEVEGIEGESFNLVGDPCLSARQYVQALSQAAGTWVDVRSRAAWSYYVTDLFKWAVKWVVRHPERRLPSYRDWQTRAHYSRFDCSKAKRVLGWQPASNGANVIEAGIVSPATEWLA
jgi:predicted dehydrogenase/nucleoside-diphosphate-sugar epimerase